MNYSTAFREDYETTGLLVSEDKMLVGNHSLEFRDDDLFLNGESK